MNSFGATGRVRHFKLLGPALAVSLAFVAGPASAINAYSCSMGGGRDAAVLIVLPDPDSVVNTCYRIPLLPRAAPARGALSCHALARRIGCVIPAQPEPEEEQP
jgi:hypothetical protein